MWEDCRILFLLFWRQQNFYCGYLIPLYFWNLSRPARKTDISQEVLCDVLKSNLEHCLVVTSRKKCQATGLQQIFGKKRPLDSNFVFLIYAQDSKIFSHKSNRLPKKLSNFAKLLFLNEKITAIQKKLFDFCF